MPVICGKIQRSKDLMSFMFFPTAMCFLLPMYYLSEEFLKQLEAFWS